MKWNSPENWTVSIMSFPSLSKQSVCLGDGPVGVGEQGWEGRCRADLNDAGTVLKQAVD